MATTRRKTIAFLQRYENADRKAKSLALEYKKESDLIDAVRSTADIDGLPKGNGIKKETEEKAIRLADKAAELKIAELDAIHERQEVAEIIFQVKNSDQREVLFQRYLEYHQKWEEICVKLHMSWGTVHNKHRDGLNEVETILEAQNLV